MLDGKAQAHRKCIRLPALCMARADWRDVVERRDSYEGGQLSAVLGKVRSATKGVMMNGKKDCLVPCSREAQVKPDRGDDCQHPRHEDDDPGGGTCAYPGGCVRAPAPGSTRCSEHPRHEDDDLPQEIHYCPRADEFRPPPSTFPPDAGAMTDPNGDYTEYHFGRFDGGVHCGMIVHCSLCLDIDNEVDGDEHLEVHYHYKGKDLHTGSRKDCFDPDCMKVHGAFVDESIDLDAKYDPKNPLHVKAAEGARLLGTRKGFKLVGFLFSALSALSGSKRLKK